MKTYHSVKELFALAEENHCSPGVIACRLESEESGKDFDEVWEKMKKTIPVFRQSIQRGLADTKKSASGLVGGDANTIFMRESRFLSPVCRRACAYAIATAEANAKMFRIVACPTAGSCGIVPAVLAAVAEEENSTLNDVTRALFTAGAIGRITAENASISGGSWRLPGGMRHSGGDGCGCGSGFTPWYDRGNGERYGAGDEKYFGACL